MTGVINLWANQYDVGATTKTALNCNNSNITGINSLIFGDLSDNAGEGIMFYRSATPSWDVLWAKNGLLYFSPNYPTDSDNLSMGIFGTSSNTDAWSSIGVGLYTTERFQLKIIRTGANNTYPSWMGWAYSAAIAFGGADTKGVVSVRYDAPGVMFIGGQNDSSHTKPNWNFGISGTSGTTYNLANMLTTSTKYALSDAVGGPALSMKASKPSAVPIATLDTATIKAFYNVNYSYTGNMPGTNNAIAIIQLNRHQGDYDSQIGFSDNGNIYYRCANGSALTNSTPWVKLAFSSDSVPMETVTTDVSADTYFTKTGWVNWNKNAGTSTTNLPTANWGILLTKSLLSVQVWIPDNASGIYFRRKVDASTAATTWWGLTGTAGNTYNLSNISNTGLGFKSLSTRSEIDATAGSFIFGTGALATGSGADWVGFQADAGYDKFQLIPYGVSLLYREDDDPASQTSTWGDFKALQSLENVTGSGGITVTHTSVTIGTGSDKITFNSGAEVKHSNNVTAGTAKGDNSKTLTFGGTFTIPSITYDANGHITTWTTTTMTMPANPNTNTTYTLGTSGNTVTLTPSSGSVQSITVPYATNAGNVYGTVTNGTTTIARYGVVFAADPNTSENNTMRKTYDFRINLTNGSTSTTGLAELVLGNANAKNTADNKQGSLTLYSPGTSYHQIYAAETNSAISHTLPATGGTILNSGNFTTTGSGNAITSVAFTDGKLTFTKGSTFSSSTHTHDSLYAINSSSAVPSTTLSAGQFKVFYNVNQGLANNMPTSNNANFIIQLNKHSGNYDSQLGFSSNGNIYYRNFNAETIGSQAWKTILDSGNLEVEAKHIDSYSTAVYTSIPINPIAYPLSGFHRSNKLAFMPAANITIEYSSDGGSTWVNYGASDNVKRDLFISKRGTAVNIGPSSGNRTTSMLTRIIVECDGRDAVLDRFLLQLDSGYHKIAVDVYVASASATTTYTKVATGNASGTWAYEYLINLKHNSSSYYRFSNSNYKKIAFYLRYTTIDDSQKAKPSSISGIIGFTGSYWGNDCKSNLANLDHIYTWDRDQNAIFPKDIIIQGSTSSSPSLLFVRGSTSDTYYDWRLRDSGGAFWIDVCKSGDSWDTRAWFPADGNDFIIAGNLGLKKSSYTVTVQPSTMTADRTLVLPDKSGGLPVSNILYENSTGIQAPAVADAKGYKYFIVTVYHGTLGEQTAMITPNQSYTDHCYFSWTHIDDSQTESLRIAGAHIKVEPSSSTNSITFTVYISKRHVLAPGNSSTISSAETSGTPVIRKIIGFM